MIINKQQFQRLNEEITSAGLSLPDFYFYDNEIEMDYYHKIEPKYRFMIKLPISHAIIGDVFCEPYTYQDSIYRGCNSFEECMSMAKKCATVTKYALAGKPYSHQVFISHSSADKILLDKFVDIILVRVCGLSMDDIIYTSIHSTGVDLGNGIPNFIKHNLKTSSLVLFKVSDNYRKNKVCLNEMGAAWALEKKTITLLLPNVPFNKLGWLTSFNKALKLNDEEGLDRIFEMLSRNICELSDWSRLKKTFLETCKNAKTILSTY